MSQAQLMAGDGKERKVNDNYPTPIQNIEDFMVYADKDPLLNNLPTVFLEPACGKGNMMKVLESEKYRYSGIGIDIENCGQERVGDFLKDPYYSDKESTFVTSFKGWIITNPPFSLATDFIETCKRYKKVNTIVFLLKQGALSGVDRYERIWKDKEFPLYKVLIIKKRLKFEGYKFVSPLEHCWFIWNRFYKGEPIIDWI